MLSLDSDSDSRLAMDFTIKVKRTKPLGVKFSLRIMKINKLSSQYEGKELFVRFINEGTGKGKKSTTHDTSLQPVEEGLAFWPPKATQPYEFKALIELDEKEGLQPYPLLFCTLLKVRQTTPEQHSSKLLLA